MRNSLDYREFLQLSFKSASALKTGSSLKAIVFLESLVSACFLFVWVAMLLDWVFSCSTVVSLLRIECGQCVSNGVRLTSRGIIKHEDFSFIHTLGLMFQRTKAHV